MKHPGTLKCTNAKWYKIRNRNYSQWVGREKLFERERSTDPNWHYWNVCASASDQLVDHRTNGN